ncbi:MAG: class II aldolase/adducin family protein [Cyanobacteriota bacterium]|nr:class II aldolase/adducin family protein [Cyanobacteriota bacterium]
MSVFVDRLEVGKIAEEIGDRFRETPPEIPALLILDRGITVWAKTAEDAYHYVELVEYIFRYMVAARQAGLL